MLLSELEIVVVSVVSETVSLVSVSVMDVLSAVVVSVSEDAVTEVVVSVVVVVTVAVVEPGVGSIGVWKAAVQTSICPCRHNPFRSDVRRPPSRFSYRQRC